MAKAKPVASDWALLIIYTRVVTRKGRFLAMSVVQVGPRKFLALVVETSSASAERAKQIVSFDPILDDHAHQNLGVFPSIGGAQRACDAFASRRGRKPSKPCDCPKVEP